MSVELVNEWGPAGLSLRNCPREPVQQPQDVRTSLRCKQTHQKRMTTVFNRPVTGSAGELASTGAIPLPSRPWTFAHVHLKPCRPLYLAPYRALGM